MEKRESRGMRNNNLLNIRINSDKFQGEVIPSGDKAFKQFETAAYGYRAAFKILRTHIGKYGLNTIRKMITRWAPPEDGNHTKNYIQVVSERSGIPADDPVYADNREMMIRIVAAMSFVENGREAEMSDVVRGWELL